MKYPVTILLILLVASQTFSKWCLILEYQVNRDFISNNLCVNRSAPLSCCKGKCYLNKKMTEDESRQQAPANGSQKDETVLQVHHTGNSLPHPLTIITAITHSTRYLTGNSQEYILSFFPPPRSNFFTGFIA